MIEKGSGFTYWWTEVLTEFGQTPDALHAQEALETIIDPTELETLNPQWVVCASESTNRGALHKIIIWWKSQSADSQTSDSQISDSNVSEGTRWLIPEGLIPILWSQHLSLIHI